MKNLEGLVTCVLIVTGLIGCGGKKSLTTNRSPSQVPPSQPIASADISTPDATANPSNQPDSVPPTFGSVFYNYSYLPGDLVSIRVSYPAVWNGGGPVSEGSNQIACPSGYSVGYYALDSVGVTANGTWGWPYGTQGCDLYNSSTLRAYIASYSNGSSQTQISCSGLCIRSNLTSYMGMVRASYPSVFNTGASVSQGYTDASCPDGYKMVANGFDHLYVTTSGTYGWPTGTQDCTMIGDTTLRATLWNYSNGSSQSQVSCNGFCVPADQGSNLFRLSASYASVSQGTTSASCPAGYTLMSPALEQIHTTNSGIDGWPRGTLQCTSPNSSTLMTTLWNYSNGSSQTAVSCSGLCVKN